MRGISTSTAAATTLTLFSILTSTMASEASFVRGGGGAKINDMGEVQQINVSFQNTHKHSSKSGKAGKSKKSKKHEKEQSLYPTVSAVPTVSAFPTLAPTITASPTSGKGKGMGMSSGKGSKSSGMGMGKGKGSKSSGMGMGKGKGCMSSKSGKGGKGGSGKGGKGGKGKGSSGKGGKSKSSDSCDEDDEFPSAAPSTDTAMPTVTASPTGTITPTAAIVTAEPTSTSAPTGSPAPTSLGFEITLDLQSVPADCRPAFDEAANRWEEVIVGDLVDIDTTGLVSNNCPNLPPIIDDVFICATIAPIDGVGGVLGTAGPEFVRQDSRPFTTTIGSMSFDSADIELLKEDGTFASVILHEMGHVLGFGTLWEINGFSNSAQPPCSYNADSKAQEEWQALSGCTTSIPLEQGGGAGTQCSHWDDRCFVDELMTGFSSGSLPISRVTVGSMEDMGYEVDYSAADPFTAADLGPSCRCNAVQAGETLRLDDSSKITSQSLTGGQDESSTQILQRASIGETKQLGRGGRRRKLSDVGRTKAFEYGELILLERKIKRKSIAEENDSVIYVGDQIVVVLYEEDGELYGVEVRG